MLAHNHNGLKGRTIHAVMTVLVVILLSLAAAGMARADDETAQSAWQVSCVAPSRSAPADCRMEQRLVAQETGQTLSVAVLHVPGDTRVPRLQLLLPTGLALAEPVTLRVDDQSAEPLPLQFCDGSGCLASLALSDGQIRAMQRGNRLTLSAVTARGEPLQLHHSLADFSRSFGAIQ